MTTRTRFPSPGARTHRSWTIATLVAALLLVAPPGEAESPQDILIICNLSTSNKTVSAAEVRDLFLKRRADWSGGGRAVPLHATEGSALREAFRRRVLEMSAADETNYWQERKIKNGVDRPSEVGNPIKAVFKVKGAISYVFRSDYKEGVARVLLVLPAN